MIACQGHTIPDEVFLVAARALAVSVEQEDLDAGSIYPPLDEIRPVSLDIATAVAAYAWDHGLCNAPRPADIRSHIAAMMYDPVY